MIETQEHKTVCILPETHPRQVGGVARHINELQKRLPGLGWEVVKEPNKADIVHVHASERSPVVDVYTNHGIHPIRESMPDWQRDQNQAIFDNLKWAREVIAVSEWTASQWEALTGVDAHIIPNGVDPSEWVDVPLAGQWRDKLKIPPDQPLILWGKVVVSDVCNPAPALEIALQRPDVAVVMTASREQIMHVPPNVHLVGRLPFPQMQALIADCDVYLATTLENHSVQVLEAMAAGKPILGYDWGGTAHTVVDCIEGRLVPPGDMDALVEALDDVLENAREYGEEGRQTCAVDYDINHIVQRTAEIYDKALEAKRKEKDPATPVCSIIIPVYNKARYVSAAIQTALSQADAPHYEVIVVNDGSTDDSLSVCRRALEKFARDDVRTILIDQKNAGVAAARNAGIETSRGRYITCLDADDQVHPHFLYRLSAAMDADPGLGIAYCDMLTFGDHPEHGKWRGTVVASEYDFSLMKKRNFIPCCNVFRRKAWERAGGYRDINPSWEDYEFWLRLGKLGWYGQRVPGALFFYRKLHQEGRDYESQSVTWKLRATVNSLHRDIYPPAVSVVIPCYQHSEFVNTAILSATSQTFPDLEVIVVDDGNEEIEAEKIRQAVDWFGSGDVRLVRLEENSGLAAARNAGIEAAKGGWIVPLDADDMLHPEFVEKTLRALGKDPNRFAYTDSKLWWPGEDREQLLEAHEYNFAELLNRITWPCTIMMARDAWRRAGGYKDEMSAAGGWEDWEFAIALGEIGVCGIRVPEPLFYYRQHSDQQMRHTAHSVKPKLQETLRRLHAATYRGEWPVSCCGNRRTTSAPLPVPKPDPEAEQGEVLVRYIGQSIGTRTWTTPDGKAYKFSLASPVAALPQRDADYLAHFPDFEIVDV